MNDNDLSTTMKMMKATICTAALLLAATCASAADFKVLSPTIAENGTLPQAHVLNGFGCSGQNVSPKLEWQNAPAGTKSFAVTVYDPDAPTGSGWWHWVVYNLPGSVKGLEEGAGADGGKALPTGAAMARTDFGSKAFGGACPPPGAPHRYVITVHALKTDKLELPADASPAMVGFYLSGARIASATLTAQYSR